ncbi:transposase [Actinoplanes sp. NPDC051411]|uniref:transposase n=1 Tax=Actinoplanes sp. NPDC051411 TaxID=3155522 RepID=UPI0034213B32
MWRVSDREWAILEPLLPVQGRRGGRWRGHRRVVKGIIWVKRTGGPWGRHANPVGGVTRPLPNGAGNGPRTAPGRGSGVRSSRWPRLRTTSTGTRRPTRRIVRAHQRAAAARRGGSAAKTRRHVRVGVAPAGD